MKDAIIRNIGNPRELEALYRDDRPGFKKTFNSIYSDIRENASAQIWHERLNFEGKDISWGSSRELMYVIILSLCAGLIAKIPHLTSINPDVFYPKNLGFVILPALSAYFLWKQQAPVKNLLIVCGLIAAAAVYINMIPFNEQSDSVVLACLHLPLFLWSILGFAFTGSQPGNLSRRLEFLRYNGDLIVMTTIILIAGAIMTGVTIGLFSLIGQSVEQLYFKYVGVWGLAAAPIVGTYLVQSNPQLVGKVSPVIARVFSPLVLVMLVVYLVAVAYSGKNPYNDRDFLLLFNGLLVGVMALILFSTVEISKNSEQRWQVFVLFALAVVTIAVNGIALSAIIFRISEWGFTANRLAVLGGNILILANLLLVTFRLFGTVTGKHGITPVESAIAFFLPVYSIWTMIVTFAFPYLFQFK